MPEHHVIITGQFPPLCAAIATSLETARAAERHVWEMFPHLAGFTRICPPEEWPATDTIPCDGFVRDCVQAFVNTGNGRPKPAPGTLRVG